MLRRSIFLKSVSQCASNLCGAGDEVARGECMWTKGQGQRSHFLKRGYRDEDLCVVRARRPLRHQLRVGESGWISTAGQLTEHGSLSPGFSLRFGLSTTQRRRLVRGPDTALWLLPVHGRQFRAGRVTGDCASGWPPPSFSSTYR